MVSLHTADFLDDQEALSAICQRAWQQLFEPFISETPTQHGKRSTNEVDHETTQVRLSNNICMNLLRTHRAICSETNYCTCMRRSLDHTLLRSQCLHVCLNFSLKLEPRSTEDLTVRNRRAWTLVTSLGIC